MVWTATPETKDIFEAAGGHETVLRICNRFYDLLFQDQLISDFVKSPGPKHGERLALWISEKLSGLPVWTGARPADSRTRSHRKAWTSEKRPAERKGWRFKLDDCRIWVRLHLWAARLEGVDREHPELFELYTKLIKHFIAVYEFSAPPYVREDAAWSLSGENTTQYLKTRRRSDVEGILHGENWYELRQRMRQ